jgi:polyisoprenoid-binding protein YceI
MKNVLKLNFLIIVALSLFISCKGDKAQKASETEAVAEKTGQTLSVDTAASTVNWTGSKPAGSHTGTISLTEGSVSVDNGQVTGGEFTMDMNSINCTDLDGDMKASLEGHLKGTEAGKEDDFFNVAAHPTASFAITKVTQVANSEDSNILVYGNLTLKGISKNVSFPAMATMNDGVLNVNSKTFKINRTDWGIKFMSNSFFDNLKDKFINDEIELSVTLVAK